MRGLKYELQIDSDGHKWVAPHAGAWIEIIIVDESQHSRAKSHLTQVRGLKYDYLLSTGTKTSVAPHAGAWIEITVEIELPPAVNVAPHAGAWIEILNDPDWVNFLTVAPHAGAWIEIKWIGKLTRKTCRRTSRRCVD